MTEQERRTKAFKKEIMTLCRKSDYGSLKGVTDAMGENYTNVFVLLSKGRIRAQQVGQIFKLTKADADTIYRIMHI